jgi:putative phosphoribosyl transferase
MPKILESDTFLFKDREDAANKLLDILPIDELKSENWILLALSKGGVIISSILSQKIGLDFDIFIVEPILAPQNDECEIAMVSESKEIVMHEALVNSFEIGEDYIYDEAKRIYNETIVAKINRFRKSLFLTNLFDSSVLLVDEGCESGLSTMCAIKSVLNMNIKKVSIAVPVIADDLFHNLDLKVDNIFACHKIEHFITTSYYYEELEKPKSKKIEIILEESKNYLPYKKESD